MDRPTDEDMGRDLAADMRVCEAAAPGPWTAGRLTREGDGRSEALSLYSAQVNVSCPEEWHMMALSADEPCEGNPAFVLAARDGWPAAIRRAMHAEAECRIARQILTDLVDAMDGRRDNLDCDVWLAEIRDEAAELLGREDGKIPGEPEDEHGQAD